MTGSTDTPDPAAAGTAHGDRRRRLGTAIAVAGAVWLILLAVSQAGPPWLDGVASAAAVATAMVVLLAAELGWERTVATAQSAGLVEPPARERL